MWTEKKRPLLHIYNYFTYLRESSLHSLCELKINISYTRWFTVPALEKKNTKFSPPPKYWSCSKAVYKRVWHIPLLSVQWMNSWWWTEELSETCRVSGQNKFVKLVHLVGFIIKNHEVLLLFINLLGYFKKLWKLLRYVVTIILASDFKRNFEHLHTLHVLLRSSWMRPIDIVIWLERTTDVETIGLKPHVLFVCSCMCSYFCDINLLLVSAHFQLAVMKPEKGLEEHFSMQQCQLSVNFCLSHNIKYDFRKCMTLYKCYQCARWNFPTTYFLYIYTC